MFKQKGGITHITDSTIAYFATYFRLISFTMVYTWLEVLNLKLRAFSLIELMVVIAIVAVLSVAAIPAYKDYVNRTKLVMAQNFLSTQVGRAIEYYNIHGAFANVEQLGLPVDGDPGVTPDPTGPDDFLAPYVVVLSMGDNTNVGDCNWGGGSIYITDFGEGNLLSDNTADWVLLTNSYIDINGTVNLYCQYRYYQGQGTGSPVSGDLLPNCVNATDNPTYDNTISTTAQTACD